MALYIPKPVPVEAVQLSWQTWGAICKLVEEVPDATIHGEYLDEDGNVVGQMTDRCGAFIYPDPGSLTSHFIRQGQWLVATKQEDHPFRVLSDSEFREKYDKMELRG